jgi:dipeptidyl aminopeptidase/acylaminoacyl peptidase
VSEDQEVQILKAAGKTVDVHYYPNEGHSFAKREDQLMPFAERSTVSFATSRTSD